MTTQHAPPRLEVRLRNPQALRDAMRFNGMNIRELSEACGGPRHRSTIGALHSLGPAHRPGCSPALAARIERVLRMPPHSLFELRMSTVTDDTPTRIPPTRGRRAAA